MMNEKSNNDPHVENDGVPLPKPEEAGQSTQRSSAVPAPQQKAWRGLGVVLLCFLASFLGAWAFLASGLVRQDGIVTQNQERIVLAEGEVVSDVAGRISPSVVSIIVEAQQLDLFDRARTTEASGTGIIITEDGYIMTNKHVVPDNVSNLQVVLADGTVYSDVRVIGEDPLNDIAFLKLNDARGLKPAQLADSSKVKVGEGVIAVGNALGEFETTVTSGIISGLSRDLVAGGGEAEVERLSDLMQTDAPINPGNSGGPLVNLKGEVIGINTAIADQAEGIGFAIPINATKGLIKTVTKDGRVARAYIGVQYTSLNPAIAKELNLSQRRGALVRGDQGSGAVIQGSPADKAGLRDGDLIIKVDGTDITRTNSLGLQLSQKVPGDTVTLTYLRDGRTQEAEVRLEELRP